MIGVGGVTKKTTKDKEKKHKQEMRNKRRISLLMSRLLYALCAMSLFLFILL